MKRNVRGVGTPVRVTSSGGGRSTYNLRSRVRVRRRTPVSPVTPMQLDERGFPPLADDSGEGLINSGNMSAPQWESKKTYVRPPKGFMMSRGQRLARYGPSLNAAYQAAIIGKDSRQYDNRIADQFYGAGKYKRRRATGRGRYTFGSFIRDVESVGRRAEPTVNRFLTKGLPKVLGAAKAIQAFRGGGNYIPMYSGRGMYDKNVLIEGGDAPMSIGMGATDNQEVVINHCEYLQDVYGPASAAFTNNQLDINPGLLENFPFLGQIAANYEEYEFMQLMFHFKSTVDAAQSATGAVGTIIMATNYNADAAPFLSKESMMQYHGANNSRIDSGIDHGVECDPSKNAGTAIRYVRTVPLVDSQQKKEFDLGKFQWAIVNIPDNFRNQQLGELWVSYTVKLGKPKLAVSLGRTVAEDRFISNGGESTTSILGTQLLKLTQSNINTSLSETESSGTVTLRVTFPNFLTGRYEVQIRHSGTKTVGTPAVSGNCSFVQDLWTGSSYNHVWISGGGFPIVLVHVDVAPATAGVDSYVEVPFSSITAGQTDVEILQYNPDLQLKWKSVADGSDVVPS